MTSLAKHTTAGGDVRPTGTLQPTHERALRAMTAIEEDRLEDAATNADAVPSTPLIARAWKLYLRGRIAVGQAKFEVAEAQLLQAFALSTVAATREQGSTNTDAMRLSACACHLTAWIYRRWDNPLDAYHTHLAAYRLREVHGSYDELWETAVELGLDADVARRYEDAQRWHHQAIDLGGKTSHEPSRKQAIGWTNLSMSLTQDQQHDAAVTTARAARECWRKHDVGAVSAARADLRLAAALVRHGESLLEGGDATAGRILDEAVELLGDTGEALSAFGPDHAADVRTCREQRDFAKRLRASLDA